MDTVDAVVGRGGLTRPIPCGTYLVNDKMFADLKAGVEGLHASNLGAGLARGLADPYGLPSFIVDPVTTDELEEVARITGLPEIQRVSRLHTLNQKAVARKVAAELGRRYDDMQANTVSPITEADVGFHNCIYRAAGNMYMLQISRLFGLDIMISRNSSRFVVRFRRLYSISLKLC